MLYANHYHESRVGIWKILQSNNQSQTDKCFLEPPPPSKIPKIETSHPPIPPAHPPPGKLLFS